MMTPKMQVNIKITLKIIAIAAAGVFLFVTFKSLGTGISPTDEGNKITNKSLVILMGNLRGGEEAWESLYRNSLDPNHADLALIVGNSGTPPEKTSLGKRARFVWTVDEFDDWADAIDLINGTEWRTTRLPSIRKINTGLWGGIKRTVNRGSGAVIFMVRWFLSKRLKENDHYVIKKYDQFVITRSDHYYECPHEFAKFSHDNHTIWVPEGEDYGGLTDRHLVVGKEDVLDAIDVMPQLLLWQPEVWKKMNPEQVLKRLWHDKKLKVERFPRVMFTCAQKGDSSRWKQPEKPLPGHPNLLGKYVSEFHAAQKVCHPPP